MPFGRLVHEKPETPTLQQCRRCSKRVETTVWRTPYGRVCVPCSGEIEGDEGPPTAA